MNQPANLPPHIAARLGKAMTEAECDVFVHLAETYGLRIERRRITLGNVNGPEFGTVKIIYRTGERVQDNE